MSDQPELATGAEADVPCSQNGKAHNVTLKRTHVQGVMTRHTCTGADATSLMITTGAKQATQNCSMFQSMAVTSHGKKIAVEA